MSKRPNLTGQRFGKLLVESQASSYKWISVTGKATYRQMWNCVCSCGEKRIVQTSLLTRGITKQCVPCAYANRPQSTRRFSPIERVFKLHVKDQAAERGIQVKINIEEYSNIIKQNCYYCDSPPKDYKVYKNKFAKSEIIKFNGIDRIDSNKEYEIGNVVPCCSICNFMKSTHPLNEFLNQMKKILKNMENKNGK